MSAFIIDFKIYKEYSEFGIILNTRDNAMNGEYISFEYYIFRYQII